LLVDYSKRDSMSGGKKTLLVCAGSSAPESYANVLPPLGTLYIASFLESKGIPTDVLDLNVEKIKNFGFGEYSHIGFSLNCSNISNTLELVEFIGKNFPKIKIFLGGPHSSAVPEKFVGIKYVDAVVAGEGEKTVYEYVSKGKSPSIKGLWIKNGKTTFFTGHRPRITNLDSLPFPAIEKVNLKKYRAVLSKRHPVSSLTSSRGCPFNCVFCFHSLGSQWAARSPKNVVDEMQWQNEELGVREICIVDDNFTLDMPRAERIADEIIKRKLDISLQFRNGIRVEELTKKILEKMKKAGWWFVSISPEVGTEDALKKIRKNAKPDSFKKIVDWRRELGIVSHAAFMVGFPWETREQIEKTISFSLELNADLAQFSRVTPMPNTELFNKFCDFEKFDPFEERAYFSQKLFFESPELSSAETEMLARKAFRSFYLRPRKLSELLLKIPKTSLFNMAKYAVQTKNI